MAKKTKKPKEEKIDGLNPKDTENIRKAIRQVWAWSHPRKLCIKRAMGENEIGTCELCQNQVGKLYADHKKVMGNILSPDYIERMWCPSTELQALCKPCHDKKTKQERKAQAVLDKLQDQIVKIAIAMESEPQLGVKTLKSSRRV